MKILKEKTKLANIKSAQKRILVAERNHERNVMAKSAIKTAVKKVLTSVKEGNIEEAKENLKLAYSLYDKAVGKGVLHKNTAARKKSRLTKKVVA